MGSPCNRYLEECEVCGEVFGSVFGEAFGTVTRRSLFSFYRQKSWHGLSRAIEVQGEVRLRLPRKFSIRSRSTWFPERRCLVGFQNMKERFLGPGAMKPSQDIPNKSTCGDLRIV